MLLSIIIATVLVFVVCVIIFMSRAQFGAKPQGERLQQTQQSPNWRDGQFQNQSVTPQLTEGASFLSVSKEFFFGDKSRRKPHGTLPSGKVGLHQLDAHADVLVWFGHSSYFIQVGGKKLLVDPVFSGNASPIKGTTRSFDGSDVYSADDIPALDYLFITHDHWDHLDFSTVQKLRSKTGRIITAAGVGAHLERWGFDASKITELDWYADTLLEGGLHVRAMPSRHFSGRGFKRNQSLWASFILTAPDMKLYLGGDSGYDTHFAEIGSQFGPFDLAILECGQYNKSWKHIHMMPEEVVQAAQDLKSTKLLPVHWAKFSLSLHDWDEPIKRVTAEADRRGLPLLHPLIGELLDLREPAVQTKWWEGRNLQG